MRADFTFISLSSNHNHQYVGGSRPLAMVLPLMGGGAPRGEAGGWRSDGRLPLRFRPPDPIPLLCFWNNTQKISFTHFCFPLFFKETKETNSTWATMSRVIVPKLQNRIVCLLVVVLSPFKLRMGYIGTTQPHQTEMGYCSLYPYGEHDGHVKLMGTSGIWTPRRPHSLSSLDGRLRPFGHTVPPLRNRQSFPVSWCWNVIKP